MDGYESLWPRLHAWHVGLMTMEGGGAGRSVQWMHSRAGLGGVLRCRPRVQWAQSSCSTVCGGSAVASATRFILPLVILKL